MAPLRLPPPRLPQPPPLDPPPPGRPLRPGHQAAPHRRAPHGHGVGRSEEDQRVVGLVGHQGRRRARPDVRRGGLRGAPWLKRVYDLAERAVPADLLHDELDDTECLRRLVRLAAQSLGVGTRADIADYHRLKGEQVDAVIADSGLVPVTVEGWGKPAWADPAALSTPPRGR